MVDVYLPVELTNIVTCYLQEYSWLKEFIDKHVFKKIEYDVARVVTNNDFAPTYHYKRLVYSDGKHINYLQWSRETHLRYRLVESWINKESDIESSNIRQVVYWKDNTRYI
jgi:hypothetical protein